MKTRTFIDSVVVYVSAGNGGNGCVSFRREKYVPRGGPDGGDGGKGGDVIVKADREVDSLVKYYFAPHQRARNAAPGRGQRIHGKDTPDLVLNVPCGTVLRERNADRVIGEVVAHGDEIFLARGGKGGRGNWHWRSPTHQVPTESSPGEPGEELTVRMDLKLVSEVGLVGYPNAGKSSLLARLSDAHPKVGAYPFTTLHPIIGTIILDDYSRIRVADIPGLIHGAHEGVGLGCDFLRHVERAPCLVFVVDMAGVDGRVPHEDYRSLREELEYYSADLLARPRIVVANKMDIPEAGSNLDVFHRETGEKTLRVSARTGDGIRALKQAIAVSVRRAQPPRPA